MLIIRAGGRFSCILVAIHCVVLLGYSDLPLKTGPLKQISLTIPRLVWFSLMYLIYLLREHFPLNFLVYLVILIIPLKRIKLSLQLVFSSFCPASNILLEQQKALLTTSLIIYSDLEFQLESLKFDKRNGGETVSTKHSGHPFSQGRIGGADYARVHRA